MPKLRVMQRGTGKDLETINKMGQEATEFVKKLLPKGSSVILELDVQENDKYGRLLAYVMIYWHFRGVEKYMVKHDGHKNLINAFIIHEGYATPMTIPPNVKYADLFKELYEDAREEKRGLWQ